MKWLALALAATAAGVFLWAPVPCHVIRVEDGDTVLVRSLYTGQTTWVRLADIDAPETGQPYGPAAAQRLTELLGDWIVMHPTGEDRYGRTVAHVGVGRAMVRAGLAWDSYYGREFELAQEIARQMDFGLWQQPDPTPPWVWRHHDN